MKYFIYIVVAIVAAAILTGFFVVGSPQGERMRRFDEQRVQNLQTIQSHIGEFYRAKNRLPNNLGELNDTFRGIVIPGDPETGQDYEYSVKGLLTFELCTNFHLQSTPESAGSPKAAPMPFEGPFGREVWEHDAGRVCFERTIDRDFFKPLPR